MWVCDTNTWLTRSTSRGERTWMSPTSNRRARRPKRKSMKTPGSEKTSLISLGWTSQVTEISLLAWALTRSASSQTPFQCNFPTVSAWQWALDAIPQGGSVVRLHGSLQRPKKFLVRTGTPDLRSCFAAVRGLHFREESIMGRRSGRSPRARVHREPWGRTPEFEPFLCPEAAFS